MQAICSHGTCFGTLSKEQTYSYRELIGGRAPTFSQNVPKKYLLPLLAASKHGKKWFLVEAAVEILTQNSEKVPHELAIFTLCIAYETPGATHLFSRLSTLIEKHFLELLHLGFLDSIHFDLSRFLVSTRLSRGTPLDETRLFRLLAVAEKESQWIETVCDFGICDQALLKTVPTFRKFVAEARDTLIIVHNLGQTLQVELRGRNGIESRDVADVLQKGRAATVFIEGNEMDIYPSTFSSSSFAKVWPCLGTELAILFESALVGRPHWIVWLDRRRISRVSSHPSPTAVNYWQSVIAVNAHGYFTVEWTKNFFPGGAFLPRFEWHARTTSFGQQQRYRSPRFPQRSIFSCCTENPCSLPTQYSPDSVKYCMVDDDLVAYFPWSRRLFWIESDSMRPIEVLRLHDWVLTTPKYLHLRTRPGTAAASPPTVILSTYDFKSHTVEEIELGSPELGWKIARKTEPFSCLRRTIPQDAGFYCGKFLDFAKSSNSCLVSTTDKVGKFFHKYWFHQDGGVSEKVSFTRRDFAIVENDLCLYRPPPPRVSIRAHETFRAATTA